MGLGDRVAIMDRGKVRQLGTPQGVYEDPDDTFVATFVGQPPMNLLPLADGAGHGTVLGFRPENFLPREVLGTAEDARTFRFHVRRVEYLGSDRYLYGTIPGSGASDSTIIAKLPGTITMAIPEGEAQEFAVQKRMLRCFDAETGARRAP